MNSPIAATVQPSVGPLPNGGVLAERTREFAAGLYDAVAAEYLQFRRTYYHEEQPSLANTPHASTEIHKAEVALLAENTLHVLPNTVKTLPVVGGIMEHLQEVADLNSISETERTTLHNMTMAFLYGVKDGLQPWYVQWTLVSARRLASVWDARYFMAYPWDACLYKLPDELTQFEQALRTGNIKDIEQAMQQIAERLITALRDPLATQFEYAFTGPDADRRRTTFRLKTAATIALGAYLLTEEVRTLLQPRGAFVTLPSALAPLPPELSAHMMAGESKRHDM
ncbi:MAG TPA: hypothetical protein VGP82_22345 [Ktedonobacterales bacterium]|nr:hypothetical protein [Ktedonobacterales bacterium]